jgi:hypothetical protein
VKFPWATRQHRLFAFITMNWRGKPLVSHQVIVQLISSTSTETGLKVCCEIDGNPYPKGSRSPTRRCRRSTSAATSSEASGTTPYLLTNNRREAVIFRLTLSWTLALSRSVASDIDQCVEQRC